MGDIPDCPESPSLDDAISHGFMKLCPRLSTNANLCRLLIRPSDEWGKTGIIYARRRSFGVADVPDPACVVP